MKNIFKSLMLVAVAAMAFTACQQDNDDLNVVTRVVEFELGFGDDTRSGFVGSTTEGEGESAVTTYQSKWDGDEMLLVKAETTEAYPTIAADGKFSVEFKEGDRYVTIASPVAAWTMDGYGNFKAEVPANQTPRTNSVDAAAHLLIAEDVAVAGKEHIHVQMKHRVAYGKMTINTPETFEVVKATVNLKSADERSLSYSLDATNVENNTFWFASEPIDVKEMTVKAYDAEGNILAKSVTVYDGKLSFNYGEVSTFSVSELVEEEAETVFTSAVFSGPYSDKILVFTSDALGTLQINFYPTNGENWIDVGDYDENTMYLGSTTYSYYQPVGGDKTRFDNLAVNVSVEDGKYKFVFHVEAGEYVFDSYYIGDVEGLIVPDTREPLATPEVTIDVTGDRAATISWNAIEGAVEYKVTSNTAAVDTTTTETSIDVTFADYGYMVVYVQAIAAEDNTTHKNSVEGWVGHTFEDPRTQLAAPEVAVTADGKTLTFTWEPVEGAASYYVSSYNTYNTMDVETEECTATFEMDYFSMEYTFYIIAKAEEGSDAYRDSEKDWFSATTGDDPSVIASYIWTGDFVWDSTNGYFKATYSSENSSYWRIFLNESDRPGNNSIKVGTYKGTTSNTPGVGEFSIRIGASGNATFDNIMSSYLSSSDTLTVSDVDGNYQIVLTYGGKKIHAYVGMPEGFNPPVIAGGGDNEGGDNEGSDNESTVDLTGYTKCNLDSIAKGSAFGATYDFISVLNLSDSTYGDTISISLIEMNGGISVDGKTLKAGSYTYKTGWDSCTMEASGFVYAGTSYNMQTTGTVTVYDNDGTYTIVLDLMVGAAPMKYYYQGTL